MEIQATHYGKLSFRRFCGKMKLENMDFSERSVFRWCNALGIKKYKRYIKPKLKPHHYISRLEWVLDDLVKNEDGTPKLFPHMPWFKAGSGKPEAGCVLYMQQDGARPHTTDANLQHFAREGAKYGFNIIVITQSAQSPDFNYNDLSFFNSLNTDVRIQSMSNRAEIIEAVKKCFSEYGAERMAGCTRSLTSSYRGCLETGGNNTYKTHRGVAKNARNGVEDFAVAKSVVDKARRTLALLKTAAKDAPTPVPRGPAPTPTGQELGLDFGRFSETSSSGEEEETGSEGE